MTNPGFNFVVPSAGDAPAEDTTAQPTTTQAVPGEVRDLIVVGSGPAGYTAALYAARAELKPLVFEGYEFGGELMNTTEVENYPGFQNGIMGPELMMEMRSQAERFGAELTPELVDRVDLSGDVKKVYVGETEYRARAVILATGAAPRHLGVPGETELTGHGVSTCATCDGFFFKDHHIAVVGGGDSAAAVRQLGGDTLNGPGWEFWGYILTALIVPVIAVGWAVTDKTRWSNLVLAVVGPTIAVMLHRMQVIWFGQW